LVKVAQEVGAAHNLPVIDLYKAMTVYPGTDEFLQADGLHFSQVGYELLGALIDLLFLEQSRHLIIHSPLVKNANHPLVKIHPFQDKYADSGRRPERPQTRIKELVKVAQEVGAAHNLPVVNHCFKVFSKRGYCYISIQ
jgi:hypothetical protein